MTAPALLRGATAIGAHLGISAKRVTHLVMKRSLPTMSIEGAPCATRGALDEWRMLYIAGKLPRV